MRFRVLDGWRGVCALFVALQHFSGRGWLFGLPLVRGAWLFVDFFFVLSGFVVAHAYGEKLVDCAAAKGFALRRFARLWPLHAAMLLAIVLLELSKWPTSSEALFTGGRSLDALVANLFLVHSLGLYDHLTWNDPSWSISTEFYTYVVFALTCLLAARFRWCGSVLAAGLALLGVVVLLTCSRWGMRETFGWGFFRCLYGFFVGTLAHRLWRTGWTARLGGTLGEVAAVILALAFVCFAPAHHMLEYFAPLVFAGAVLVFAAEAGLVSRLMRMRPMLALGAWSYSIYMVHAFVLAVLFSGVVVADANWHLGLLRNEALMLEGRNISDIVAILYLMVVVALASQTYRFVERPGQRLFLADKDTAR